MGNKINATAFRIGVNKNWRSIWYQPKQNVADTVLEDIKIRKVIGKLAVNAGIDKLILKRAMSKLVVELSVARPGVVIGKGGAGIEDLKAAVKKVTTSDVNIKVFEVKRPEIQAALIAQNVAQQCERRVNPKRAAMKAAEDAMNTGKINGVHIWIRGRIKGAEIARMERVEMGTVPRHTLRADIDYAAATAQVPSLGTHGIKVWVNRGEKLDYEINS
jgi:small subunit ribosomal protein S3